MPFMDLDCENPLHRTQMLAMLDEFQLEELAQTMAEMDPHGFRVAMERVLRHPVRQPEDLVP